MASQDKETNGGSSKNRYDLHFLTYLMESRGLPVPSQEELELVELQVASNVMNQSQSSNGHVTASESPCSANQNSSQADDESGEKDMLAQTGSEDFTGTRAATSKSAPENHSTGTRDDIEDVPGTQAVTSKSAPGNQETGTQDDVLKDAMMKNGLMENNQRDQNKEEVDVNEPEVVSKVRPGNSSLSKKVEENVGGKNTNFEKGKRLRSPSTEMISSDGLFVSSSSSDSAPENEKNYDGKEEDSFAECKRKYDEIKRHDKENIPPTVPFPPPTPPHIKRRHRLSRPVGVRMPLATIFGGSSGVNENNPGPSNAPPPRHSDSSDSSGVDEPNAKKPRCGEIVQAPSFGGKSGVNENIPGPINVPPPRHIDSSDSSGAEEPNDMKPRCGDDVPVSLNPVPMRTSYVEARAEGVSFEEM